MAHRLSVRVHHDSPPIARPCSSCHGRKVSKKRGTPCRTCGGTGVKPIDPQRAYEIEMVMMALRVLTPPACPEASTKEISNHIRKVMAMSLSLDAVSRILVYLERDGLVIKRREGQEALWSISHVVRAVPSTHESPSPKKGASK